MTSNISSHLSSLNYRITIEATLHSRNRNISMSTWIYPKYWDVTLNSISRTTKHYLTKLGALDGRKPMCKTLSHFSMHILYELGIMGRNLQGRKSYAKDTATF